MSLAEEFREKAKDCLQRAQEACAFGDQSSWLDMAQFWLRLAQLAEERDAIRATDPVASMVASQIEERH